MTPQQLFAKISGVGRDVFLFDHYKVVGGQGVKIEEGEIFKHGGVTYPILREKTPFLSVRIDGGNMHFTWSYNDTLKTNANIVIMGSSHSVSLGVSAPNRLQDVLLDHITNNWPGTPTITNIGEPGIYSTTMLPSPGGDPDRNITKALSYNPGIILYIAPTNDVDYNTPASSRANIKTIYEAARKGGAMMFVHSPVPRGSFNNTQQQELVDNNAQWQEEFPYPYFDLAYSDLWDGGAGGPLYPNTAYYQGDLTHLTAAGILIQAAEIIKVLERELRPNTAYLNFIVERSDDGSTGWTVYDTITDQQVIGKTYALEAGHYRVKATLKDGSSTPYSDVVPVAAQKITQISFAGASILAEPGWISATTSNPHTNVLTVNDPVTGWTISTVATNLWIPIGGGTTGMAGTQSSPDTYVFPKNVYRDYIFSAGQYANQPNNIRVSGLDIGKMYKIEVLASRSSNSAHTYTGFTFQDDNGVRPEIIVAAIDNKTIIAEETGLVPNSSGEIYLTVARASTMPTTGEYAGFLNAMRITEL